MVLRLARASRGLSFPDPAVAALLVKDHKIISWGYHAQQGTPHAEAWAIQKTGPNARGSTLYINLEPCSHWGNNPPCAETIIRSGIKKVICSMTDPNPLVLGQGFARLRKAGLAVLNGVLAREAREINESFIKHITTGLPFVILKMALTLDGKIATSTGDSRWISGPAARRLTHIRRGQNEAIMVGVNTVIKDDPALNCRLGDFSESWADYLKQVLGSDFPKSVFQSLNQQILPQPVRIILDGSLRIPLAAKVIQSPVTSRTLILTTRKAVNDPRRRTKIQLLRRRGVLIVPMPDRHGRLYPRQILSYLGRENISSVLIEGGSQVAASFIKEGLVDKLLFFISPKLVGAEGLAAIGSLGIKKMSQAITLIDCSYQKIGQDLLVTARLAP